MSKISQPARKVARFGANKAGRIKHDIAPDFHSDRRRWVGAVALGGAITSAFLVNTAANFPVPPELTNIPLLHMLHALLQMPDAQNLPDLLQDIAISLGKQTFFGAGAVAAAGMYPRTFAALGQHVFGARPGTPGYSLNGGSQEEVAEPPRSYRVTSLAKSWLGANALGPLVPAAKDAASHGHVSVRRVARTAAGGIAAIATTDAATHTWQLVTSRIADHTMAPEAHALSTALTSPLLFVIFYLLSQHGETALKATQGAARRIGSMALQRCCALLGRGDQVSSQEQLPLADQPSDLVQQFTGAGIPASPLPLPHPGVWSGEPV